MLRPGCKSRKSSNVIGLELEAALNNFLSKIRPCLRLPDKTASLLWDIVAHQARSRFRLSGFSYLTLTLPLSGQPQCRYSDTRNLLDTVV